MNEHRRAEEQINFTVQLAFAAVLEGNMSERQPSRMSTERTKHPNTEQAAIQELERLHEA
eukprot:1136742-Pelagomonas_calceolata.AAC.1